MGFVSGYLIAILSVVYAAVLAIGLLTLPTPADPIQNPWFTIMELLILVLAPVMVLFTTSLRAWVPPTGKSAALLAIVFMGMCAVVTCSVHFVVLTLSRQPAFIEADWAALMFSFTHLAIGCLCLRYFGVGYLLSLVRFVYCIGFAGDGADQSLTKAIHR